MANHFELYEKITSIENIERAHAKTMSNGRKFRATAVKYNMEKEMNLLRLQQRLVTGTYQMQHYIKFWVYEPKRRLIYAPRLEDKIVQLAIHNVIKEIYAKVFIADSYACQDGKGTLAAVNSVQRDMRIAEREFKDPWIVAVDVSKFFYSINRPILKELLKKKIKCRKTLWLLYLIIDSSPTGISGMPGDTERGIPLGNVTSQDFANITLNEVDQYVQRFLGIRYYTRYMDDMIAIVDGKDKARELKRNMERFLINRLKLEANPKKSQIFPLKQGVNAYGYKIWTTHKLVRDDSKRAMKRRIKAMDRKLQSGQMELEDVTQAVSSWLGHARHSNSFNLCKKIFAKYEYIKVEGDEQFGNR